MMTHPHDVADWVQWSVHHPTPFICTHIQDLLPTWSSNVASVVIFLQRCPVSLSQRSAHTEHHKDLLRDRFIQLGLQITHQFKLYGYDADLFDPKSGLPLHHQHGTITLDDVAMAHRVLGFSINHHGGCTYLVHPTWGDAVYPSSMVSSAPINVAGEILHEVISRDGNSSTLGLNGWVVRPLHQSEITRFVFPLMGRTFQFLL